MGNNSLKSKLKNNNFLRRRVKAIKNHKEYFFDAVDFNKYYIEKAEINKDYRYTLMLLIHSLEKGLCSDNPRPFGASKVKQIITILRENTSESNEFEYQLAASALKEWLAFHLEKGYKVPEKLIEYIDGLETDKEAGCSVVEKNDSLLGRRSVRDFENREICDEDIDFALKYFQSAPTACNRQMCSIYQVKSKDLKNLLADKIIGIGSFNISAVTLFLVTFDIASLSYFGERSQGYLNAGLTAMNFVNGLHLRGVGSCFLQWSNKRSEDKLVREKLGLKKSERIGVVIGAGYYKDNVKSPKSARKDKEMIYKVI